MYTVWRKDPPLNILPKAQFERGKEDYFPYFLSYLKILIISLIPRDIR
jgi:hypothetical protein